MNWINILGGDITLHTYTKVAPTKGNLVYEYNPLRNYRLTQNMYEYEDNLWTIDELEEKFGITPNLDDNKKSWRGVPQGKNAPKLRESGELVDFITNELQFDLTHPVHITPQASYDGSVNLILNDGKNTPKLINTRFSATGKNTYEVIDRKGNNDTNIYDQGDAFNSDTSLYKTVSKIPHIKFIGTSSGGNLKIGNYFFYFKLSDDDGNETDFIGESGLVSVFIGQSDPKSITSGQKNENSFKNVKFVLDNLDISYNFVTVYYSRDTAEGSENAVTEYKKIDRKYSINNAGICNCVITGFEPVIEISAADINLQYQLVDSAKTAAVCQNMLFLGNVHKPNIPYEELQDLSLHFCPYLKEETYDLKIDQSYSITSKEKGYYDPKFIYEKTGYWGNELYRFGIVYILPNGELSPVFNIRGGINVSSTSKFSKYDVRNDSKERVKITYNEMTNLLTVPENDGEAGNVSYENNKGVVSFAPKHDTNYIYGVEIKTSKEVIDELKNYAKGYFFVRQPRIPTILAQGITVAIDKTAHTPTLSTQGGILDRLKDSLDKTHVVTENILGVNHISEGFLSRYSFGFKEKKTSLWKKTWKVVGITAAVAALAVATVYTGGAALATVGAVAGAMSTVASAATATAIAGGVATAAVGVGMSVAATAQNVRYGLQRVGAVKKLNGRNTKTPSGYTINESSGSRVLTNDFEDRIIIKDSTTVNVQGILCPDYELNQPYYNQIFTGNTHKIELTKSQGIHDGYFDNEDRHFYIPSYEDDSNTRQPSYNFKVIVVKDDCPVVGLDGLKFRSRAGNAEEAWRYECIGDDYKIVNGHKTDDDSEFQSNKKINSDIIRGSFGPYLAFNDTENKIAPAKTVNIYIPDYSESNLENYIKIRMQDETPYSAISDRISLSDVLKEYGSECSHLVFRGDCYICQFTHRLNRNFNAPSSPYNDEIVDENTWKKNYNPSEIEKYADINLGDVNAVQLGMWVTFTIRSSKNLNIRTIDGSNVDETIMSGHPRGYYPYLPMDTEGAYKKPESSVFNNGFNKKLGDRWNMNIPDVPYIKNWFGTRIMYSDIHINDAYLNGFRVFRGNHYRDYTREYGEITKLISRQSDLVCVFEHGIAVIPVNERAVAAEGSGGFAYINTSNVLPENPKIISDMFGSQWADSILKVPGLTGDDPQYIYGVDTVAKKIWRLSGETLECISDMRVQEFLNENISLGERENTPILGIRNVKTFYNAFKQDVMFTFYDNLYGQQEKVWNLCWNELLKTFVTFYSWVPSFMENINNVPFSFDRNVSKWVAKLGISHSKNSFADGITLTTNIINKENWRSKLSLSNRFIPEGAKVTYELVKDPWNNYEKFEIDNNLQTINGTVPILKVKQGVSLSNFYSELYYRNKEGHAYGDDQSNKADVPTRTSDINENYRKLPIFKNKAGKREMLPREQQINPDKIVTLLMIKATISQKDTNDTNLSQAYYAYNEDSSLIDIAQYTSTVAVISDWNQQFLTFDFWKHGQAGLIDIADDIYPTYWYGKQHPFEFEFIVADKPQVHKIFTNMEILSNKAKPESFHYEVIGDVYDFAKDKPNMYFRQEALKALWQYNGLDISYNKNFLKVQTNQNVMSADLIHEFYMRQDTVNEIEDYYVSNISKDYNYRQLSGGEITYYPTRQEFRIQNHVKAVDLSDLCQENARALLIANMEYLEDKWNVQISPLQVCYKNEEQWPEAKGGGTLPYLNVANSPIPDTIIEKNEVKAPTGDNALTGLYENLQNSIDISNWAGESSENLRETDMRGRFIKIKIRYSGEELAIISWINTIYQISYV